MYSFRLRFGYLEEWESLFLLFRLVFYSRIGYEDGFWFLRLFIEVDFRKDGFGE